MGRRQKYQILEKIDSGGMAEIYKAKAISIQGIEKVVAIKRILPSICKNKKFVTMFLDEARLSMHLAHANVVQVFDLGRSEDSYFIVMEFVDGYNLRRIFQRANEVGQRIPLKIALFIITEMLKGLGHAHELKDSSNRPLGIVHRDVSPANVLISKSGEVKLTDFGLAKAITQVELTDPGIVKGKFSYLSPEAIEGKRVDNRADIFSTGIVLWELLANRRLFLGRTEMETIEAIEKLDVPSLQLFNPEVTIDLENIIKRALERKPKKRFASAFEMGETISRYLFSRNLKVTSYDLADYVRNLFEKTAMQGQTNQEKIGALIQDEILSLSLMRFSSDPMPIEGSVPLSYESLNLQTQARLTPQDIWCEERHAAESRQTAESKPVVQPGGETTLVEMLEGKETIPMLTMRLKESGDSRLNTHLIYAIIMLVLLLGGAVMFLYFYDIISFR